MPCPSRRRFPKVRAQRPFQIVVGLYERTKRFVYFRTAAIVPDVRFYTDDDPRKQHRGPRSRRPRVPFTIYRQPSAAHIPSQPRSLIDTHADGRRRATTPTSVRVVPRTRTGDDRKFKRTIYTTGCSGVE